MSDARYQLVHSNRINLAIHLVAVPVFVVATLAAVVMIARGRFGLSVFLALGLIVSMAAQGIGHRLEPNPPNPFHGPLDALSRILREQFYTFPRFVLTGAWLRAWRAAPGRSGGHDA